MSDVMPDDPHFSEVDNPFEQESKRKDAEIERLLTKAEKDKNTLLISLEAATKEVQRLRAMNYKLAMLVQKVPMLKRLITELCDALEAIRAAQSGLHYGEGSLIHRARKETR